jgi:serine/threonine protein kinase
MAWPPISPPAASVLPSVATSRRTLSRRRGGGILARPPMPRPPAQPVAPGDVLTLRDAANQRVPGAWRVEARLGRGALGEVWRARDERGAPVAVKLLHEGLAGDDELAARFAREARLVRRLAHAAIPAVYADGRTPDGRAAIVMERVDGEDLAAAIAREGRLPVAEALRVGARVAAVLADAHEAGVLHRDIKPQNLMRSPDGAVRVLDFGVALSADEPRLTATGVVLGSPWYLSPEQCRGEPATPASDLYALGATMVHALTGEPLFPEASGAAQMLAHLEARPPSARARRADVPAPVDALLASLVEKDPARRPLSAAAAARSLDALARWVDAPGAPVPEAARPPSPGAEALALRRAIAAARRQAAEAEARIVDEVVRATARAEVDASAEAADASRRRVEGLERAMQRVRAAARSREEALRDALARLDDG